jgi:hypothetical protein
MGEDEQHSTGVTTTLTDEGANQGGKKNYL